MKPFRLQKCQDHCGIGWLTVTMVAAAILIAGGNLILSARADDTRAVAGIAYPDGLEPVSEANFSALMTSSPFLRSLDLSDSLILTGIARIEGEVYVTLLKRDTKETHIVSGAAASNPLGMRLVEVDGDQSDLETVTAQIAMSGGEVFSVRFDERQLKPGEGKPGGGGPGSGSSGGPPRPVRDYREGISGDGFRGPPPPELVKKLSKLSSEQRDRLIQEIGAARDRGVSSEERQVMFGKMVDRALQERR
ncbi:MAG: hypothetical protein KDN20_07380 [Verrucomicrobiae bacterium]|nr:hypothetical protein [Verrucomicrobiae bacterium]